MKQIDLLSPIIVDNFAGGGGASTGIELATGMPVTIAINHDPDAIAMHKANHPYTEHYQENVWNIDPATVCRGRHVGLAWFSPDCKHFSKAKGGKPVDKNIRGLAWVTLRWAGTVRPDLIILENVEEFQTWGPVRRGKPVKSKSGQTFRKFVSQLEALGYVVEWRELVAADYGAPTTRKRFFLIARCDGKPIVWPEPTHAPRDSEAVKAGRLKPWRSAAEIIDWSLPCPSIFDSREEIKERYGLTAQRPLRPNTMRRVCRGIDKFVIKAAQPFIVPVGYGERAGQLPRVHNISDPLPTSVGVAKHSACVPYMVQVNHSGEFRGQHLDDPLQTITAKHGYGVVSPVLTAIGQTGGGNRCRSVEEPTHTQVSKAEECVVCPTMIQYHTEQTEKVRGQAVTDSIKTIDASNRYGIAAASLTKYYGSARHGQNVADPLHTITAKDREGVMAATFLQVHHAGGYHGKGQSPLNPVNTITSSGGISLQIANMLKLKGGDLGSQMVDPVHTITAGGTHHGLVVTRVEKMAPGADLHRWPEIRQLLNEYCDYHLADDEVILFDIGGEWYYMADIGLRMLIPRELYRANGFPYDYIIDRDYLGNEYGKSKQVARCGNSVPPPFATALVRVNFPDWCKDKNIQTMRDLTDCVAG